MEVNDTGNNVELDIKNLEKDILKYMKTFSKEYNSADAATELASRMVSVSNNIYENKKQIIEYADTPTAKARWSVSRLIANKHI